MRNGNSDRRQNGNDSGSERRPERGGSGSRYPAGPGNVRAKKHLGQHFLTDLNIARKISDSLMAGDPVCMPTGRVGGESGQSADSGSAKSGNNGREISGRPASDCGTSEYSADGSSYRHTGGGDAGRPAVLEVGPGMGVLTQFLLQRNDIELYAAEIDAESVEYLRAKFPQLTPRLLEEDFLKMDIAGRFPYGVRIIGNFPYNISSQIFFKVLENRDIVPEVVGMVQREVAVRIAEPPGSREYGILSVLLQAWYDIEYLFTVNENVFVPPPKVKSAVIRLKRNKTTELDCDEKLFVKVVKASFGQRRKMLKNSLKAVFGDLGGEDHPFFTTRAEQLSVADFVELTRWISERVPSGKN